MFNLNSNARHQVAINDRTAFVMTNNAKKTTRYLLHCMAIEMHPEIVVCQENAEIVAYTLIDV